jgi:hypothetical protein
MDAEEKVVYDRWFENFNGEHFNFSARDNGAERVYGGGLYDRVQWLHNRGILIFGIGLKEPA